jgi:hydroxymethylglutaryl-CoA synthase
MSGADAAAGGAVVRALASYVPAGRVDAAEVRRHWDPQAPAGTGAAFAVPDFDEDVVTMAVEVAERALAAAGTIAEEVDAIVLATCSSPYGEPSAAGLVARALRVGAGCETVTLGGSPRGGLQALRVAAGMVAGDGGRQVLAIASDDRHGRAGTALERRLGAAAAAAVVGAGGEGLRLRRWASHRHGVPTQWRSAVERALESGDDPRFERDENAAPAVAGALAALDDGAAAEAAGVAAPAALAGPVRRAASGASTVTDGWADAGDAGTAGVLLALERAWRDAAVGDRCRALAYESGAGADAALVEVAGVAPASAPHPEPSAVGYVELLRRRGLLAGPAAPEAIAPYMATPAALRDAPFVDDLTGLECAACGSLNFPARPSCIDCGATALTPVPLPRTGRVVTHNSQFVVAVAPEPAPVSVGVVRLDGARGERGGQLSGMFVAGDERRIAIGAPVELVHRRLGSERGLVKYGWKLRIAERGEER